MRKIVAIFMVVVAIAGCAGFMVVDSAFSLYAKSKVKEETTITDASGTITREFKPKSFDKIEVEGQIKVDFTQGKQTPVVVTGRQLEMEHLEVVTKGSTLEIKFDKEYYNLTNNNRKGGKKLVTVRLSAPSLSKVEMSLSSSFNAGLIKQSGNMEFEADTSASIDVRGIECGDLSVNADTSGAVVIGSVSVQSLDADADTSGSIRVNGVAEKAVLKADTSGSVRVNNLAASSLTADVDTSGSVHVEVFVGENVIGRADTSGRIVLKGVAKIADFNADTSGSIKAGELKVEFATVGSETGGKVVYCAKRTKHTNSSLVNTYEGD